MSKVKKLERQVTEALNHVFVRIEDIEERLLDIEGDEHEFPGYASDPYLYSDPLDELQDLDDDFEQEWSWKTSYIPTTGDSGSKVKIRKPVAAKLSFRTRLVEAWSWIKANTILLIVITALCSAIYAQSLVNRDLQEKMKVIQLNLLTHIMSHPSKLKQGKFPYCEQRRLVPESRLPKWRGPKVPYVCA